MSRPDPSQPLPLRYRVEAGAARAFLSALGALPIGMASAVGAVLARVLGPLSSAHRTAARNLARALPERDAARRRCILGQAWGSFGRTMAEYAVLPRLWPERWRTHVSVSGHETLAALAAAGKPAILFSAHLGNWEMIPLALAQLARPLTIVYRAPNNPSVDALIGGVRAAYTSGMAPKGAAGARLIMKALHNNELVFMVVDQKINEGLPIPFFGRAAFTGTAIARLAMRFQCPVIPVRCVRTRGCRFEITVEEPWTFPAVAPQQEEEAVRAALMRVNARIEDWIRATPGQWLWMHKRWPKDAHRG
jgi:KDO2-lipid IV(A) lauroyltransferase